MKKFSTTLLLALACVSAAAAMACSTTGTSSSQVNSSSAPNSSTVIYGENRTISFENGEGFKWTSNVENGGEIPEGSELTFTLDIGAFYTGTPIVYVNDAPVAPTEDGSYAITVGGEDMSIRAEGIRKDISNMIGSGTMDDAFLVTKPIDLIYIAEQVNKGNRAYSTGSYILANDIDCKGEELEVIGNYSNENAVFSGCFSCVSNSETGEIQRTTISNFTINSESSGYVGLFGAVFADLTVTGSGLFYGIRLSDFTINAGISQGVQESKTVSCGSLIGYAVGASVFLCDALNGEINLTADQSYFSFAGGLIGYQQGFYEPNYDAYYPAEVAYARTNVDVNVIGGMALYAGGISGYIATNYALAATASIHNSYALGSVNGALRSGGIAGGMGQYTVVSNCYAMGEITARASQDINDPLATSDEYSYAHAGGIVGFAENDSIAHDCFFNGSTSAYTVSGKNYAYTSSSVAGGDNTGKISVNSQKYLAIDCLENVNFNDDTYLTKALGWQVHDWNFVPGSRPDINYGTASGAVAMTMTLQYVAPNAPQGTKILVNQAEKREEKYIDTSVQSSSSYNPIGSFFANGSLSMYYEADNGYLSYGYFFDEACTQRVPYSYLPMKNVTLYIGFADPTPILGTYYFTPEHTAENLSITFTSNGIATYSDGVTTQEATYYYDGTTIVIEGARLARYYLGEIIIDEDDTSVYADPNFDLYRYMYYDFKGEATENGLIFYDGEYYTKDNPLTATQTVFRGEYYQKTANGTTYYTFYGEKTVVEQVDNNGKYTYAAYDTYSLNGDTVILTDSTATYAQLTISTTALTAYDAFKGSWVKSATVNKLYTFDGIGNWEYTHVAYERTLNGYFLSYDEQIIARASGNYEIRDEKLYFTHDGVAYEASFNTDGFLTLTGGAVAQTYYRDNSYAGKWQGIGYTLTLFGLRNDHTGLAEIQSTDGFITDLVYEVSETSGVIVLYYPHEDYFKNEIYGYFTYDVSTNTLTTVQYNADAESGYVQEILYLFDDYCGEWICNIPALQNVEFDFNGFGLYTYIGMKGTITLTEDGEKTTMEYTLDSALRGKFAYKGVMYEMEYDEDEKKVLLSLGTAASLERKDEFANIEFIDLQGNIYTFDGKSSLDFGGKLKAQDKTYQYYPSENGYTVYDNGEEVGSIEKTEKYYQLTIGTKVTELYITNEFMGDWAISNQYALFHIGPTDLSGVVKANFKGMDVELTYIDPATLTFRYRDGKMPITYYVFVIFDEKTDENVLVLSEFTNLLAGEYFICSKANGLFGTWEWNRDDGKTTLKFDGVSSGYVNGYAELTLSLNYTTVTTEYFYTVQEEGIVMWSREPMAERTWYFRLDLLPESEIGASSQNENAFVLYDAQGNAIKALLRAEVDGLYLTKAFDKNGVEYVFNGEGKLLVSGAEKYSYVIKAYNSDNTATLEVTDLATGITYEATLDYSDNTHILFTLGEEITEEA